VASITVPRFDVVVLVETSSPAATRGVQATPEYLGAGLGLPARAVAGLTTVTVYSPKGVLTRRDLNRATLARYLLLERAGLDPVAAVEHLVGLQAQTPHSWYVGLWSRVAGLDPVRVAAALGERRLVRTPVMRSTIHLLTADDALVLRPLTQPPIERSTMGAFGRHLVGVDRNALVTAVRELVEKQPRALTG